MLENRVKYQTHATHHPIGRDYYKITGFGCISTGLKIVSFELLTQRLKLTQNS